MKEYVKQFLIFATVSNLLFVYAFDPCTEQFEIETDLSGPEGCREDFYQPTGGNFFKCFPRCLEKWDYKKEECNETLICPPGFECVPKDPAAGLKGKCEVDLNSCFKYQTGKSDNNPWTDAMWRPECNPDGTWKTKQCKPNNSKEGRCYCYDKIGKRIFGQEFADRAENMTCACSRRKVELEKTGSRFYTSLHCDSTGNYEPLQCDSEQCWCVEPKSGEITAAVVPEHYMTLLPCYSQTTVGEQYLRQCESEEYAKARITFEFETHGTAYSNLPHVLCDGDGTYGPYQISAGQAVCTWKDKSPISSYRTNFNILKANCNCARDSKYYEAAGRQLTLKCEENGNYLPLQEDMTGKPFCVDNDGFTKKKFEDVPTLIDCSLYLQ